MQHCGHLYPFSLVAVTNYHKLSGLRKLKLTFLHFWRAEVQNPSHWYSFVLNFIDGSGNCRKIDSMPSLANRNTNSQPHKAGNDILFGLSLQSGIVQENHNLF